MAVFTSRRCRLPRSKLRTRATVTAFASIRMNQSISLATAIDTHDIRASGVRSPASNLRWTAEWAPKA